MPKRIFLDLDGPILDVSLRYYAVHCDILRDLKVAPAPLPVFWEGKRRRFSPERIQPGLSAPALLEGYRRLWLERIEDRSFLCLDRVQPGAVDALRSLRSEGVALIVATLRQSCSNLSWELERLDVRSLVDDVLCSGDTSSSEGRALKRGLIEKHMGDQLTDCLLVGDTEVDIMAARDLRVPAVAVLSGIRNRESLAGCCPDFIVADLAALPALLPLVSARC